MLHYFKRLKDRMERRDFPKEDKLYRRVACILEDMHDLTVSLHYLTCDGVERRGGSTKTALKSGTPAQLGPTIC